MTDEHKTVIFPQHERKHEPTVEEKIKNIILSSPSPQASVSYIVAEFPNLKTEELITIMNNVAAKFSEEQKKLEHEVAAIEGLLPMFKQAEDITGRGNLTPGEALTALAEQGNKKAAAYLEHLAGPEARFWAFITDRAVESDPYWVKEGKYFRPLEGATHKTPEALAHAYAKNHMDEIIEDLPLDLKEWLVKN